MEDDTEKPWGVTIDFESWRVVNVDYNRQFYKHGVHIGHDVLQVDGTSVRDDPEKCKEMLVVKKKKFMFFEVFLACKK